MIDFVFMYPNAVSPDVCKSLIEKIDTSQLKPGTVIDEQGKRIVQRDIKDTHDIIIDEKNQLWRKEFSALESALFPALQELQQRFNFLTGTNNIFHMGWLMQKYETGGHFDWHQDGSFPVNNRMLAVIVYLNEDFEGGNTEFLYQGTVVKPQTGTMIIFPTTWTHLHRSTQITKGKKYIATCWIEPQLGNKNGK